MLLTNRRRLRWLLGGLAVSPLGCLGLLLVHRKLPEWLVLAFPALLLVQAIFYDRLVRQPAWVLVAADEVAWANPADSAPTQYQFAELRAYRFETSKIDSKLLLYPKEGNRRVIVGRLHQEFWAMELAFRKAVLDYNQAHSGAEVAAEPSGLTKFFTRPLATQVLWGLLALGAAWVAWGLRHDAPGVAYLPLLFIGLPYLLVWANFYYERS